MTLQQAKNHLLSVARGELGAVERGDNIHPYAAAMEAAYGWDVQGQPWCDVFVDWCFVQAFGLEAAGRMTYQRAGAFSALCSASAARYRENGAWNSIPEPGDQVFFRRGGSVEHTGLVEKISGVVVSVIEGNSSDAVARRSYVLGSSAIAGYGRPDWSVVASDAQGAAPAAPAPGESAPTGSAAAGESGRRYHAHIYRVEINLLKQGDRGPQVERVQQLLAANGFACAVDGEFGDETRGALLAFQKAAGVCADGEFGGESFAALWNWDGRGAAA